MGLEEVMERAVAAHWADGALKSDLRLADIRARRRAMEIRFSYFPAGGDERFSLRDLAAAIPPALAARRPVATEESASVRDDVRASPSPHPLRLSCARARYEIRKPKVLAHWRRSLGAWRLMLGPASTCPQRA